MTHDRRDRPHQGLSQVVLVLAATASVVVACGAAAVLAEQKPVFKQPRQAAKEHGHGSHGKHAVPGVNSLDVYTDGERVHMLIGERNHAGEAKLSYRVSADAGETW